MYLYNLVYYYTKWAILYQIIILIGSFRDGFYKIEIENMNN